MFIIENEELRIEISAKGAELQRIHSKRNEMEYLWNGDPSFWAKHSPVLFPIVGTLKDNSYYYGHKRYELGRHGFAREMNFEADAGTPDSIEFTLSENDETLPVFPFLFSLSIRYSLSGSNLKATYIVKNTDQQTIYFSVGAHPAFNVPLTSDTEYSDYYISFNQDETLHRWPISKDGLIENHPMAQPDQVQRLNLSKELFYKDALVYKHHASTSVALLSDKTLHGLRFSIEGFPYLGIWAAKNAPFVCIEPWCGIADSVDSNQQLIDKEGIVNLSAGDEFRREWNVELF